MRNPSVGTPTRGHPGMRPANQLGSRTKYIREKFSHGLRASQRLLFDHALESHAGTRAGFGEGTARIHGIGWGWRNLWAFQRIRKSRGTRYRFGPYSGLANRWNGLYVARRACATNLAALTGNVNAAHQVLGNSLQVAMAKYIKPSIEESRLVSLGEAARSGDHRAAVK